LDAVLNSWGVCKSIDVP